MAKKSKLEFKRNKDLASKVLEAQGKNYDQWLDEMHLEIINDGANVIEESLKMFISSQKGS